MQHLFWLVPRVLVGRSGPTKDLWNLQHLRDAGIGAVLSVNDGALCHPEDFEKVGLLYRCLALSPNAPPQPGDLEHCVAVLPDAYAFVLANEEQGLATLVHCHSGKDRTALFMAYYLCRRRGLPGAAAIERVKAVRPIAFTAVGWEEFALEVLASTTSSSSSGPHWIVAQ
ncbi:MAG TPA: protein phosphatase [Thermoanaerobaculia bacterium]|jgi:protein-tyrosine phosphatase|nr:protein phosphatase [Thermoanaerobaculia bacterium]